MVERIDFTPHAKTEIAKAYDWYDDREPGLGEEFLRCLDACVFNIQRTPNLYPAVEGQFRRALVRRFPFEIFYETTKEGVLIYSVFHGSQDPEKWRKLLEN